MRSAADEDADDRMAQVLPRYDAITTSVEMMCSVRRGEWRDGCDAALEQVRILDCLG